MRLIDADRLLEILEREEEYHSDIPTRADGIKDAIMDVISAPTVDAVPVVRCENCIFWDIAHVSCEGLAKCCTGEGGIRYRNRSDFCSRGARKDGDHAEGTIQKERS